MVCVRVADGWYTNHSGSSTVGELVQDTRHGMKPRRPERVGTPGSNRGGTGQPVVGRDRHSAGTLSTLGLSLSNYREGVLK